MRRVQIILGSVLALLPAATHRSNSSANSQTPQQSAPPARFAFGGNAAQVPAEFVGNLIFVPVDINRSQPSLFVVDSTAAISSISENRAKELALDAPKDPTLNFPGVDMPFANLAATDKPNFSSEIGRPYQGTLGADFFSRVVVEIDYARQTLRLYDPAAYNYSGKGTSFPLKFEKSVAVISAKFSLPGQKSHEGDFAIDTALDASLVISERFAEAHRMFSSRLKTISATDPELEDGATIAVGRLKEFQIGRYLVHEPLAAFVRHNPILGDVAGVIGGGMLRRFTVVFDYAHQQLILAPNTRFEDYEQEDKSGIALVAKGPGLITFEVVSVQPGTPGAEAGVLKGDVIAGIEEEAAADLNLASIRGLFRQAGHKYKLLIQRNGESLQITVQMRRLL